MNIQPTPRPDSGTSLLVVDDHPAIAKLVGLFLKRSGLHIDEIHEASTVTLATEKVIACTYDLILVDGYLSPQEGFRDIIQGVRPHHDGPIILLSGSIPEDLGAHALDADIVHAISKDDLSSSRFTDMLSEVLGLPVSGTQPQAVA